MATKAKKKDFVCTADPNDEISVLISKAFGLKADIRVMKEQKNLVKKGIADKLGDISHITEYMEKDLGNGVFITVRPPYSTRKFEEKVYSEYLDKMGLKEEAYKRGIYSETDNVTDTLRFASDYVAKTALTFTSFINYIRDAEMPDLARTYLELNTEINKIESEYDKTVSRILDEGCGRLGQEMFATRFVYDDGNVKGTLSFSRSFKKSVDLERAGEMLPSDMGEEERKEILKSGSVVYSTPVISVVSEAVILKRREKADEQAVCENEEISIEI